MLHMFLYKHSETLPKLMSNHTNLVIEIKEKRKDTFTLFERFLNATQTASI